MDAASALTAPQAAARLGVKVETLYAYVSRGRITRHRTATGSLFDPLEVEAFARARRRERTPTAAHGGGSPLMVLDTDIALVEDDELYFRGRPARELAERHRFEQVVAWLFGGSLTDPVDAVAFALRNDEVRAIQALTGALPAGHSLVHRHEAALLALAASDPLRGEATTTNLARAGMRAIAGAAVAVSGGADDDTDAPIARRLAEGWAPGAPLEPLLDAALILLVDHDLAVSTLAARAAASARASAYGVIAAGLGALDSPLHGGASAAAVRMIGRVLAGASARDALSETVSVEGRGLPGFGQFLYTRTDPRADVLLTMLRGIPRAVATMDAIDALATEAERTARRSPNVDLALAAIVTAFDLPPDAGTAVFAIARSAGWIAHALDEYARPPLRLRPQGRYVESAP